MTDRRRWRCPSCGKLFSIPADRDDPLACPNCAPDLRRVLNEFSDSDAPKPGTPMEEAEFNDDLRLPPVKADHVRRVHPALRDAGKFLGAVAAGVVLMLIALGFFGALSQEGRELERQAEEQRELTEKIRRDGDRQRAERIPEEPVAQQGQLQRQWVEVGRWSGKGIKTTERFSSKYGEMRVTWAAQVGEDLGHFGLTVTGEGRFDSHLAANEIIESGKRSDTTRVYGKAGRYYLEISGTQLGWAVVVEDFR